MFTGIIEEIGKISAITKLNQGAKIEIQCLKILEDANIGDSICVNGICQTITEFNDTSFNVMLSPETMEITNFNMVKRGDYVNLERALTLNKRLGGHIVSGHIDCTGTLIKIQNKNDFYDLIFKVPNNMIKYIVYKGSITINGISLTISNIEKDDFTVSVIPHTYNNTVLKYLHTGDIVNIETDILAKYVEKLLGLQDNKLKKSISMEFLEENGFV